MFKVFFALAVLFVLTQGQDNIGKCFIFIYNTILFYNNQDAYPKLCLYACSFVKEFCEIVVLSIKQAVLNRRRKECGAVSQLTSTNGALLKQYPTKNFVQNFAAKNPRPIVFL